MASTTQSVDTASLSELSLTQGGPLFWLETRLKLFDPKRLHPRLVLVLVVVTWLPLVVLALAQRVTEGHWDPLLLRTEAHVRLLVSLPLFLFGELLLEHRVRKLTRYLARGAFISSPALGVWHATLSRVRQLRDARAPEWGLLGAVYGMSWLAYMGWLPAWVLRWLAPTIHQVGAGFRDATPAVWWYLLVSQPLFLFVLLRWFGRWLLFTSLMWRLSSLQPRTQAGHADSVGGLGFLNSPLYALRFVAAGTAFAIMSVWLDEITRSKAQPAIFAHDLVIFLTLSVLLAVLPYTPFTRLLVRARLRGRQTYSALVDHYLERFEKRWLGPTENQESMLGHPDFSGLADLGTSFKVVDDMRTFLPGSDNLKAHLIASVAPFLIIVLIYGKSTAELIRGLAMKFLDG